MREEKTGKGKEFTSGVVLHHGSQRRSATPLRRAALSVYTLRGAGEKKRNKRTFMNASFLSATLGLRATYEYPVPTLRRRPQPLDE